MLSALTVQFERMGQLKRKKNEANMENAVLYNGHTMDDIACSSTTETLNTNTLKGSPPKTGVKSILKILDA